MISKFRGRHKRRLIIGSGMAAVLLLFIFTQTISGDHEKRSIRHKLKNRLYAFIPPGYAILDTAEGHLNGDNIPDLIMILKKEGEDTMISAPKNKRPLLLLAGNAIGSYHLMARNDHVVRMIGMGGASKADPFDGIEIENQTFTVHHSGGKGTYHWFSKLVFGYSIREGQYFLRKTENREVFIHWETDSAAAGEPKCRVLKDTSSIKTPADFGKLRFEIYTYDDFFGLPKASKTE